MNTSDGVIHFKDWDNSWIPQILKEMYIDNVYAPYLYNKTNLTILDLGLNIGLFSMFASRFAKQIYAFEPAKQTFDIAKKNIEENGLTNVKLYQKAIAKDDGTVTFWHADNTTMNSTMEIVTSKNAQGKTKEEVEAIRLDTFVGQEGITHIDFAKIDIEGTECEVIGSKSFQNIVPILESFVVEYHEWSGVNVQQLVTTIRDYGYVVNLIPAQAVILGAVKK